LRCAALHEPPVLWDGRTDTAKEKKLRKRSTVTHSQQEKQVLSGKIENLVTLKEYENDRSYCWPLRGRKKIKRWDANKYGEEKEKSKRRVI
jgi:hypothetical protein